MDFNNLNSNGSHPVAVNYKSFKKKNSDFFYSMKTVVTCTACRTTDSSTIKI